MCPNGMDQPKVRRAHLESSQRKTSPGKKPGATCRRFEEGCLGFCPLVIKTIVQTARTLLSSPSITAVTSHHYFNALQKGKRTQKFVSANQCSLALSRQIMGILINCNS